MKKYFMFCLMAILAACSSDKGDGLSDGWMNYRNNGVPTNNDAMTSMVQNDELNLGDADFTLSNNDAKLGQNMQFSVSDKGVITAVKFSDVSATETDDANREYTTFRRGGNSTLFYPTTSKETVIKRISTGSGGKFSNGESLRYSDFGSIVFGNDKENVYYATYTGGYKDKEIQNPDVDGMSFKGAAKGYVHGRDKSVLVVSGDATLKFDNDGTQNLTANFKYNDDTTNKKKPDLKDWYTVTISGTQMNFAGYETDEKNGNKYMFDNKTANVDSDKTYLNTAYYGDDKVASEVVGSFGHTEAGTDDAGVRLDAAFGGVKQ